MSLFMASSTDRRHRWQPAAASGDRLGGLKVAGRFSVSGEDSAVLGPLEAYSSKGYIPCVSGGLRRGKSAYVTKEFARFARKADLADAKLLQAAQDVAAGHYDADLGGGVFKQRIARKGAAGKSGGFRTIILFRVGSHSFFAYGFAKNDKANVPAKEQKALKRLADVLLGFSEAQLEAALAAGELIEVENDGDKAKG